MQEKVKVVEGNDPLIVFSGQAEFILAVAQLCRNEGHFVDVTIKCSDGELKAHKIILGSSSVFLRDLLLATDNDHDTFVLDGYNMSTVSLVLDFLYTGQLIINQQEALEIQGIFSQLGVNPDNVSSEDLYSLTEDPLLLESSQDEQFESSFPSSDEISDVNLKVVNGLSENESEEEKENGGSLVNTPTRKRVSSSGNKLPSKKPNLVIKEKVKNKSRNSKNRKSLGVPSGVHDLARVETWLCSICKNYNPPTTDSNEDETHPGDVEWIGCDCSRWYHIDCTKINVNKKSFSCKDIKFKCLKPIT